MPLPSCLLSHVEYDLTAKRGEYLFNVRSSWQKRLQGTLKDPRDLPVATLLVNITLLLSPAAYLVARSARHWVGAVVLVLNYVIFLQRFLVALLHISEHRQLFSKEYGALNYVVPYLLAPLYGVPCGMYKLHHKVMHHVEGNTYPWDSSSTVCYQRDSFFAFLRYWAGHAFGAWVKVPLYAYRKGRYDLLWECLASEVLYLAFIGLAMWTTFVAALWLLIIPFIVTSLALMFGNWSQHVFVDTEDSGNPFKSTYNCIGCSDNQRTFNDGYHILHHLNSQTHWSQLPQAFIDTWDKHAEQKALTFVGIGVFDVGLQVMLGRWNNLADSCFVDGALPKAEKIQLMKSRLKPLAVQCPAGN